MICICAQLDLEQWHKQWLLLKGFRHIAQNPQVKQEKTGCFVCRNCLNYLFVFGYFHFIDKNFVKFCKICLFPFLSVLTVWSFNVVVLCKLYKMKRIKFRLLCVFSDGVKDFPKQINRTTYCGLHSGLIISRNCGDLSVFINF